MNKALTTFVALAAVVAVFVAGGYFFAVYQSQASVGTTSEYSARTYSPSSVGTSSIKQAAVTLGSVVISSTSPLTTAGPAMAFYDTASATQATTTMTPFAQIGAVGSVTAPAGTYTFDVMASTGIQVWVDPSFRGIYTVTYR